MFGYVTGRAVEDNAVVTLSYPKGAIAIVETGYVTHSAPFTIDVHGTQGSLLYSEPGIGQRVAHRQEVQFPASADGMPTGPDGKLRLRSASIERATNRWLVQDVTTAAAPKAFSQWISHIQKGTKASENIALGLELTALIEASNRSAATGQRVRITDLEHVAAVAEV